MPYSRWRPAWRAATLPPADRDPPVPHPRLAARFPPAGSTSGRPVRAGPVGYTRPGYPDCIIGIQTRPPRADSPPADEPDKTAARSPLRRTSRCEVYP